MSDSQDQLLTDLARVAWAIEVMFSDDPADALVLEAGDVLKNGTDVIARAITEIAIGPDEQPATTVTEEKK